MSEFPRNTTHLVEATNCTDEQRALIKQWLAEKDIDATQVMAIEIRKTEFQGKVSWTGEARMYMTVGDAPNALNPHGFARVLPGYMKRVGFFGSPKTELDHALIAIATGGAA